MQHVNRIAVEDANDGAGEISSKAQNRTKQKDVHEPWNYYCWKALGSRIVNRSIHEIFDVMAKAAASSASSARPERHG